MPEDLSSEKKLEQFLTDLARRREVSASTQNQAPVLHRNTAASSWVPIPPSSRNPPTRLTVGGMSFVNGAPWNTQDAVAERTEAVSP